MSGVLLALRASRRASNISLKVSPEGDSITLTGDFPGITRESTLLFWAYDTLAGQDGIACQSG